MTRRVIFTIPGQPIDPDAPIVELTPDTERKIAEITGQTVDQVRADLSELIGAGALTEVEPAPVTDEWIRWAAEQSDQTAAEVRDAVDHMWMLGALEIDGVRHG